MKRVNDVERVGAAADWARVRVDSGALRKEIEALRGLLAAQRVELGAARAEGERLMRDMILRWHEAQFTKYRELSSINAFAGGHMDAHQESIAAIRALAAREPPAVITHPYVPHPKSPWFCRDCGYPEHERLKHEVTPRSAA